MYIFRTYFLNFWVWWYLVKGVETLKSAWRMWLYSFEMLRIGPMLGNLFQPFFQDKAWTGRVIAFPIRFIWGLSGLIIQIIFSVFVVAGLLIYFVLPVVVVFLVIKALLLMLI